MQSRHNPAAPRARSCAQSCRRANRTCNGARVRSHSRISSSAGAFLAHRARASVDSLSPLLSLPLRSPRGAAGIFWNCGAPDDGGGCGPLPLPLPPSTGAPCSCGIDNSSASVKSSARTWPRAQSTEVKWNWHAQIPHKKCWRTSLLSTPPLPAALCLSGSTRHTQTHTNTHVARKRNNCDTKPHTSGPR